MENVIKIKTIQFWRVYIFLNKYILKWSYSYVYILNSNYSLNLSIYLIAILIHASQVFSSFQKLPAFIEIKPKIKKTHPKSFFFGGGRGGS